MHSISAEKAVSIRNAATRTTAWVFILLMLKDQQENQVVSWSTSVPCVKFYLSLYHFSDGNKVIKLQHKLPVACFVIPAIQSELCLNELANRTFLT